MIQFQCQCGKNYQVSEQYAGKKVRCKKCNSINIIPQDSPEEFAEEASYQETSFSNYWLVLLCSGLFVLIIGGLGAAIYVNYREEKVCLSYCIDLQAEAQDLWDQDEFAQAKEAYEKIIQEMSERSFDNTELDNIVQEAKNKIIEADNIVFAQKYLTDIKKQYKSSEDLFVSNKMSGAQRGYSQITSFIKEHKKEDDSDFSWINHACQKRLELITLIELRLKEPDAYKDQPRQKTISEYDQIINELSGIRNPNDEIEEMKSNFEQLKTQAIAYYDEVEKQLAIAEQEEEQRHQVEQRRLAAEKERQQAAERLRKQDEIADSTIKQKLPILAQIAKDAIKATLKAPSTALFENTEYLILKKDSDIKSVLVAELDDIHGQYTRYSQLKQKYPDGVLLRYSGDVDAQNSYGAQVRSRWYVTFFYSPSQDFYNSINGDVQLK